MQQMLLFGPIIVINLWHIVVLLVARQNGRSWRSISESAASTQTTLLIHRVVHIAGAACFITYAIWLATNTPFGWVALALALAALCDATQVITLSQRTKHYPVMSRDIHQLTAWAMAAGYLVFSVAYAFARDVSVGVLIGYAVFLLASYAWSAFTKHKYFWLAQMIFFFAVSGTIVVSGSL